MAMEQSLFGPSAASVQDQLLQQDAAFGNNLTPTGLATAIGGSAGRHIGNLMGMEDPRVAEAKAVQEAVQELRSSGVDMNDPAEYFKKMAGIFGAKGLTKQAEMAAAKALEYQTKKEERADRESQRKYKLDEHTLAMEKHYVDLAEAKVKLQAALAKSLGKPWKATVDAFIEKHATSYTPDSLADYVKAMNDSEGNQEEALRKLALKDKAKWGPLFERTVAGETQLLQQDAITGAVANRGSAAPRITNTVNGAPTFDKLQVNRERYVTETKPYNEVIRNAQSASQLIDNAVNNPAALGPARHAFASVFKVDSQMGKKEIEQLVASGDLPGRLAQQVWGFLSGQLTPTNAAAMKEALAVRERIAMSKKAKVQQVYRNRTDLTKSDMDFVTSDAEEVDSSVEPAKPATPSGMVGTTSKGTKYEIVRP